jgi:hypothetical protein
MEDEKPYLCLEQEGMKKPASKPKAKPANPKAKPLKINAPFKEAMKALTKPKKKKK